MKKKVVMQDIADRLNISKNSVSQALSGKGGVSEETRLNVLRVAQEMGYQYQTKKRSSKTSTQTKTIGLIASEFAFTAKHFFGEIYLAIERETQRNNTNLLIQSITPDAKKRFALPSFIEERKIDGLLILSHISTEYIHKVLSKGIPTVLVDHHHPSIEADAVLTNNRFGAYTAVKHLIDLNHTDIAVIGNIHASPSYQERWEGYMLALREHGLEVKQERMFIDIREEEAEIAQVIDNLKDQPSAWFCLNDGYGYFVCSSLQRSNLSIPDDVSVCGFDNNDLSKMSVPKMTTMDINLSLFAKKAVSQLLWRIDNPEEVNVEILLPTKLVKRESTGRCMTS